jgi:hypothetical protein
MVERVSRPRRAGLGKERLVGAWRLVSWEVRYPDGTVTHPFGRRPLGLLLYTPDGAMSANIAARGRRALAVANPRDASAVDKARLLDSFFAYAGRYSLRGSTVRHRVSIATNPALVGTLQVRDARLAHGRLELAAAEKTRGGERRHVLTWARGGARAK